MLLKAGDFYTRNPLGTSPTFAFVPVGVPIRRRSSSSSGHTHSSGDVQVLENLRVLTSLAKYRELCTTANVTAETVALLG
jgi:hypothetical protein